MTKGQSQTIEYETNQPKLKKAGAWLSWKWSAQ